MTIDLHWRIVRRTDAELGTKETVEGKQSFATFAQLRTAMRAKIDDANLAGLYKINMMVVVLP